MARWWNRGGKGTPTGPLAASSGCDSGGTFEPDELEEADEELFKFPPQLQGWVGTADAFTFFSRIEEQEGLIHIGVAEAVNNRLPGARRRQAGNQKGSVAPWNAFSRPSRQTRRCALDLG